jgi:hypothetical protein
MAHRGPPDPGLDDVVEHARAGRWSDVEAALAAGFPVNFQDSVYGDSVLHWAVDNNHESTAGSVHLPLAKFGDRGIALAT